MRVPGSGPVLAGVVTVISQALFAVLTTRWLDPGSRGSLLLGMTLGGLITVIASMGFTVTSRSELCRGALAVREFVSTAQAAVLLSLPLAVLTSVVMWPSTVLSLAAFASFVGVYGAANLTAFLFREAAMGLGRVGAAMLVEAGTGLALVIAVSALQSVAMLSLTTAMVAVASLTVAGAALQIALVPLERCELTLVSRSDFRRLLASRGSLAFSAAEYALTRWDRLVVGLLLGSDVVAYYGAAATYGQLSIIPVYGARQLYYSRVAAGRSASGIAQSTLGFAVAGSVIAAGAAPLLVPLLFGQAFSTIVAAAAVACLTGPVLAVYQLRRSAASYALRNRRAAEAAAAGFAVFALACVPAYAALGFVGLTTSLLMAAIVATVLMGRAGGAEGWNR